MTEAIREDAVGVDVVDTYRVTRRQDLGGRKFREAGELMPEAHGFWAVEHWLRSGGLEEAKDVPASEFVAAVEKYCPEQAEQLYAAVGLDPEGWIEGGHNSPRVAPMVPQQLPETANHKTVVIAKRPRGNRKGTKNLVNLTATGPEPGAATGAAPAITNTKEKRMAPPLDPSNGRVYEDATTPDPAALNEALTNTRPADIEAHTQALEGTIADPAVVAEEEARVAEQPVVQLPTPVAAEEVDPNLPTVADALAGTTPDGEPIEVTGSDPSAAGPATPVTDVVPGSGPDAPEATPPVIPTTSEAEAGAEPVSVPPADESANVPPSSTGDGWVDPSTEHKDEQPSS